MARRVRIIIDAELAEDTIRELQAAENPLYADLMPHEYIEFVEVQDLPEEGV